MSYNQSKVDRHAALVRALIDDERNRDKIAAVKESDRELTREERDAYLRGHYGARLKTDRS